MINDNDYFGIKKKEDEKKRKKLRIMLEKNTQDDLNKDNDELSKSEKEDLNIEQDELNKDL